VYGNGDLKLVVEGEVFRPQDELRGVRPEIRIAEPQKAERIVWFNAGMLWRNRW